MYPVKERSFWPTEFEAALEILEGLYVVPPGLFRSIPDIIREREGTVWIFRQATAKLKDAGYIIPSPAMGFSLNRSVLNRSMAKLSEDMGFPLIKDNTVLFESSVERFKESLYLLFRRTSLSYFLRNASINEENYADTIFGCDLSETLHHGDSKD